MNRKISTLFLQGTLRAKILTLFLCLIAIPLSLQGIITYSKFSASTELRTAEYTEQIVGQINRNLERNIREIKRLSLMPLYDPEILSILKEIQTNTSATSVGTQIGIRETRRIVGEYSLTIEDVVAGRRFPDVVARSGYRLTLTILLAKA
ncbi:hypothetical protein AA984_26020 [Brevibacillus formosus]|uniref:Uncharacterized protein n=1 Tax=Brevibacillus formosus TaxID=54913 RepID=A0A837KEK8_9BACL|nr:hypothetical protein AA984_26020 [Brevibacillus formosus]GED59784.1 hypothetical protein BFO01nite_39160 [Brevibacillus formosus]